MGGIDVTADSEGGMEEKFDDVDGMIVNYGDEPFEWEDGVFDYREIFDDSCWRQISVNSQVTQNDDVQKNDVQNSVTDKKLVDATMEKSVIEKSTIEKSIIEEELGNMKKDFNTKSYELSLTDLVMMQMVGEFNGFLSTLRKHQDTGNVEHLKQGMQMIEETRKSITAQKLFSSIVQKTIEAQFGEKHAALRELGQNAIDAYEPNQEEKNVMFKVSEEKDYIVLKARDYGCGMDLESLIKNLLIPYNSGKEFDPNKIGEHGIGFYSLVDLAKLVKVTTKSKTSPKFAEAVIYKEGEEWKTVIVPEGKPLFKDEQQIPSGTEVTAYISKDKNTNEKEIENYLYQYLGMVDPNDATIFFNKKMINSARGEYMQCAPVKINSKKGNAQLSMGVSLREMHFGLQDERFVHRNKNLEKLIHTQRGLFIKYESSPFDGATIHSDLTNNLIRMGMDFWVQLPKEITLTKGRNNVIADESPAVLEGMYEAFEDLFTDVMLNEPAVYSSRRILEIMASLFTSKYQDRIKTVELNKYSFKRRALTHIAKFGADVVDLATLVSHHFKEGLQIACQLPVYAVKIPYYSLKTTVNWTGYGIKSAFNGTVYGIKTAFNGTKSFFENTANYISNFDKEKFKKDLEWLIRETAKGASSAAVVVGKKTLDIGAIVALVGVAGAVVGGVLGGIGYGAYKLYHILGGWEGIVHYAKTGLEYFVNYATKTWETIKPVAIPGAVTAGTGLIGWRVVKHREDLFDAGKHFVKGMYDLGRGVCELYREMREDFGEWIKNRGKNKNQQAQVPIPTVLKDPDEYVGPSFWDKAKQSYFAFLNIFGLYVDVKTKRQAKLEKEMKKITQRYLSRMQKDDFFNRILNKKIIPAKRYVHTREPVLDPKSWTRWKDRVEETGVKISVEDVITFTLKGMLKDRRLWVLSMYSDEEYAVDYQHPLVDAVFNEIGQVRHYVNQKYDVKILEDHIDTLHNAAYAVAQMCYDAGSAFVKNSAAILYYASLVGIAYEIKNLMKEQRSFFGDTFVYRNSFKKAVSLEQKCKKYASQIKPMSILEQMKFAGESMAEAGIACAKVLPSAVYYMGLGLGHVGITCAKVIPYSIYYTGLGLGYVGMGMGLFGLYSLKAIYDYGVAPTGRAINPMRYPEYARYVGSSTKYVGVGIQDLVIDINGCIRNWRERRKREKQLSKLERQRELERQKFIEEGRKKLEELEKLEEEKKRLAEKEEKPSKWKKMYEKFRDWYEETWFYQVFGYGMSLQSSFDNMTKYQIRKLTRTVNAGQAYADFLTNAETLDKLICDALNEKEISGADEKKEIEVKKGEEEKQSLWKRLYERLGGKGKDEKKEKANEKKENEEKPFNIVMSYYTKNLFDPLESIETNLFYFDENGNLHADVNEAYLVNLLKTQDPYQFSITLLDKLIHQRAHNQMKYYKHTYQHDGATGKTVTGLYHSPEFYEKKTKIREKVIDYIQNKNINLSIPYYDPSHNVYDPLYFVSPYKLLHWTGMTNRRLAAEKKIMEADRQKIIDKKLKEELREKLKESVRNAEGESERGYSYTGDSLSGGYDSRIQDEGMSDGMSDEMMK